LFIENGSSTVQLADVSSAIVNPTGEGFNVMMVVRYSVTAVILLAVSFGAQSAETTKPGVRQLAGAKISPGDWAWVPRSDTRCRDGSSTGIGVRLLPGADAVMIYLQGGGACYDAKSCAQNAATPIAGENFSREDFAEWVSTLGNQGIFNTVNPTNPVARWNHVYIPYCTGDLHGGVKENGSVPGVAGRQQFVGYRNLENNLKLIAPFFRNAEDVALVGASAGGVGVLVNYPQVVDAFGGRSVVALVDSAPVIPESAIKTSCFQRKVTETFDLHLPPGCPECAEPSEGGLLNIYGYLSRTYPHGRFAFASADADLAGVILYNQESRACGGAGVNIFNYRLSLYALRDRHIGHEWATFLPGGVQHTMTQSDALFLNRKYRGVSAAEWLGRINYKPPTHIPAARLRKK
jgi:hypothetical protein